jgi:hypothetical protein
MKSLTAIAALVASVSASAGELDGKALLCLEKNPEASLSGYFFRDGKVFYSVLQKGEELGDVVVNEWEMADSYHVGIDTVRWQKYPDRPKWETVLDRKTLEIKYTWGSTVQEWICEVAESMEAYHQTLEAQRVAVEKRIAERMKENRI